MFKKSFFVDYKFGKNKEIEIFDVIKTFFDDNIKYTTNFMKYDYEGEKYIYEVKSRNNAYNKYDTTLIGHNKVLNNDKEQIFIFNFTDGTYYIKYDKELFSKFEVKDFKRNIRKDYEDKTKPYYYIPITELKKII
jgi:hypothetical protein